MSRRTFPFRLLIGLVLAGAFTLVVHDAGPAAPAEQPPAPASWKAGFARVVITPDEPIRLAGYASRSTPSEGVVHDLYARALALEDSTGSRLIIVSAEVLGFPRAMSERIERAIATRFHLPPDRIVLAATHTHTAPVLRDSLTGSYVLAGDEARRVQAYTDRLEGRVIEVVGRALGDLAPARLAFGSGTATFGVNRRVRTPEGIRFGANPDGPTDPDVPVLRVETPEGRLRGVLFGYACHNTTLTGDFNEVAGDYAGFAQAALETRHPDATAIYLMGAGADIDPQPRGTLEHARDHGETLAREVERVLAGSLRPLAPSLSTRRDEITLPFRLPDRSQLEGRLTDSNAFRRQHADRMLGRLEREGTLPPELAYPLQVVRLGELTLVALTGEVVVDYALRLKRELGSRVWVAAYCHHVPGYIPSERILAEGGYEADFSTIYYDLPGPFAPGLEDRITAAVRRLSGAE